jgi:acetoin utilization deacetylase AcuC-like enzyme/GNAT superfamily N-acetyltransferase
MFRIRKIYDVVLPANSQATAEAQKILAEQFPNLSVEEIDKLPDVLTDPMKHRFRSILFVAENGRGGLKGFALLMHDPELSFCFLDFISTAREKTSRGIGGALYERVREEALALESVGLFFEVLPDDPKLSRDARLRKQNEARLRFYERYGARPISHTKYETPLKEGDDNPPYLVFDDLGQAGNVLRRRLAQKIVKAILERKYGDICPQEYIDMVVESFKDDPVRLRAPKYIKAEEKAPMPRRIPDDKKIVLIVNDRHDIHHIRERGYVEAPIRITSILNEIEKTELFLRVNVRRFSEQHIRKIHDPAYVNYFKSVCAGLPNGKSIYPYTFPIRNQARPPKELSVRAGYYCIDTFTPLNKNAFLAAKRAVDCALTGVKTLLEGARLAYALVRPPGHHAERRAFGGFCYFNSNAIAADYLSEYGKVAILDIDYHHGNGQQQIFYHRDDVLTISIHGHPRFAYPYFSGFTDEKGEGAGKGFNVNYPLPESVEGEGYAKVLDKALVRIAKFRPQFLVVPLGLDTAKADPTGSWRLTTKDFENNGLAIGRMKCPTLVVQEGGYNTRNLGINARHFFIGLWNGAFGSGH